MSDVDEKVIDVKIIGTSTTFRLILTPAASVGHVLSTIGCGDGVLRCRRSRRQFDFEELLYFLVESGDCLQAVPHDRKPRSLYGPGNSTGHPQTVGRSRGCP